MCRRRHRGDLFIEAIARRGGGRYGVEVVIERRGHLRVVEPLPAQPQLVQPGPGLTA
jgi:hypothetical protein